MNEILNFSYFQVNGALKKKLVYYQIMHVIITIHKTSSVKVGFEHQIGPTKFKSTFHLIYDTKVFQSLYSTYYKINGRPCFFIFLLSQVLNLFPCVYIKNSIIFRLHFGHNIFLSTYHAFTFWCNGLC